MVMSRNVGYVDPRSRVRRRAECVVQSIVQSIRGLCGDDRRLSADLEPPLGAHLITPRFAYAHHGVYVGSGTVVHYAAFAYHWHRGPVEEVSLSRFAHGHSVWVRPARPDALRCEEIVRRARSRVGENRYRLLSNNCEHFSEWCVHGEHRSPQAERLLARLRRASGGLREVVRWLTSAPCFVATRRSTQSRGRPVCCPHTPPTGQHTLLGRQLRLPVLFFDDSRLPSSART